MLSFPTMPRPRNPNLDGCNLRSNANAGPEGAPLGTQGSWSPQASRFGFLGLGIVGKESIDTDKFRQGHWNDRYHGGGTQSRAAGRRGQARVLQISAGLVR